MELPSEPAVTAGTDRTGSRAGRTERADSAPVGPVVPVAPVAPLPGAGTVVTVTRTNPLYGHDTPFIRVAAGGDPDPVTAAIAGSIGESGTVYLELPDGRLTVVLDLEGMAWVPRARDEGIRG
jgi:hypothetical protein